MLYIGIVQGLPLTNLLNPLSVTLNIWVPFIAIDLTFIKIFDKKLKIINKDIEEMGSKYHRLSKPN